MFVRQAATWSATGIGIGMVWLFVRGYNPRSCYTWGYDAHNKEILSLVDLDRKQRYPDQTIYLASTWLVEPSLRFYKERDHLDWLGSVEPGRFATRVNQYFYVSERDIVDLPASKRTVLAAFLDTHTVLLRIDR
jgi:hypothetical protein